MRRTVGLVIALALALVAAAAVPAAGLGIDVAVGDDVTRAQAATPTATPAPNTSGTGNGTAPGAMLSGVVGVGAAELRGDLDGRRFGLRVAAAASNRSKAAVVASQVTDLRDRLRSLRADRDRLRAAYENGSIGEDEYRARTAALAARIHAAERLTNRTAATADTLPAAALRANGVNATAIGELRRNASSMMGPEVAAIARQIAGNAPGAGLGAPGPPPGAGPPSAVGPAGNGSGPPSNASMGPPGNTSEGQGTGSGSPADDRGDGRPGNAGPPPDDRGGPPDDPGNAGRPDSAP